MTGAFLNPPRIPALDLPPAATIRAVAGDQLADDIAAVYDAHTAALTARHELESHRPGGAAWKQAMASDANDPTNPHRVADCLHGDPVRFATAHALARQVPAMRDTITDRWRDKLRKTALAEAKRLTAELHTVAKAGWEQREDLPVAWEHRRTAEQLRRQWATATVIARWAHTGGSWQNAPRAQAIAGLIPDGTPGGYLYALAHWIDGTPRFELTTRSKVKLPTDYRTWRTDRAHATGAAA